MNIRCLIWNRKCAHCTGFRGKVHYVLALRIYEANFNLKLQTQFTRKNKQSFRRRTLLEFSPPLSSSQYAFFRNCHFPTRNASLTCCLQAHLLVDSLFGNPSQPWAVPSSATHLSFASLLPRLKALAESSPPRDRNQPPGLVVR